MGELERSVSSMVVSLYMCIEDIEGSVVGKPSMSNDISML